jgi:hypothetical protein
MKTKIISSILSCLLMLAVSPSAFAGKSSCSLLGGWVGYDELGATALITYDGKSESYGASDGDFPALDPTLYGAFPTAVKTTSLRGEWKRTGGNTFDYTLIVLAMNDANQTVGLAKFTGDKVVEEDCTRMVVSVQMEVYLPNMNPFGDDPLGVFDLGFLYAYPMRVDPPFTP